MLKSILSITALILFLCLPKFIDAQENQPTEAATRDTGWETISLKPQYLPPSDILDLLGARKDDGQTGIDWVRGNSKHHVDIRFNDMANLIILSGNKSDLDYVGSLISEADIPPRQIEIQIEIVEINDTKAMDAGLDWQSIMDQTSATFSFRHADDRSTNPDNEYNKYTNRISEDRIFDTRTQISRTIKILDEVGAANIHSAPKILTLNNKCATILDGQRVTYVTRYSSYTNLFETDSMDAGLTMTVCPSVGESGYLTLQVSAEYTTLAGEISGSPIKDGQLIENTIIVKNGESVLLGGLSRVVEERRRLRFPLLGHILPFVFSREIKNYENVKSFMILTPRIVDLSPSSTLEPVGNMENTGG